MPVSTSQRGSRKSEPPLVPMFRLKSLSISNYKAIDSLSVEFDLPTLAGDPDVVVLGSKNGVGKTSILEAASFVLLGLAGVLPEQFDRSRECVLPDLDFVVQGGAIQSEITGTLEIDGVECSLTVLIGPSNYIKCEPLGFQLPHPVFGNLYQPDDNPRLIRSLLGFDSEPLFVPGLVYFNSYRKVSESRPQLGELVGSNHYRTMSFGRRGGYPDVVSSTFKLEVLKGLMAQKGLFEDPMEHYDGESEVLKYLLETYAHGRITKVNSREDNSIDLRVAPLDGGRSYSFDGLSSGQKEIISTLFLTWRFTAQQPSVVLIDEPELHLNAEWHRKVVHSLQKLAPKNQYILATHSEDIFGSVARDRRMLLDLGGGQR